MTQNAQLLSYLETHDGISTLEAMERLRILRLSQRVIELEHQGYLIEHQPEKTSQGKRIMRYRLLRVAYG